MTRGAPRRRFPGYVYRDGTDPDPRFSLANERTFLAWLRTALALAAVAVALDVAAEIAGVEPPAAPSLVLTSASALVAVAAWVRWSQVERALRRQESLPGPALTGALTGVAVAAVALLAAAGTLR